MIFNFELSTTVMALLAVCAVSTIIIASLYCPFIRRINRRSRQCRLNVDSPAGSGWPAASVIIYSRGEADRLEALLPTILSQDYEGAFEVIVVNEGDSADVRNVISALQLANRNLYLTFTPDGARNLSRKKLALTLGIKAARNGIVVHTTSDAIISSPRWLTKIMRNFSDPSTDIVLGYASPVSDAGISRTCTFEFADDCTSWLSSAIDHRPFRGTELNLAYRKELFFANKGFSRSLNLHSGDNDIFISEIASKQNTAVELSPESIVHFSSYDFHSTIRDTAVRHLFTQRFIKHRPWPRLIIGEAALWLAIISACVAAIIDINNAVTISAAAVLLIACATDIAISWRKATTTLGLRRLTLTAPWFTLTQPLRRTALSLYARLSKQKKYTWD